MSTALALPGDLIANIVIRGDLSGLNDQEKTAYYRLFCERVGLDPMAQPFKLLKLNGKEILYCDRSGSQQLNRLHNVSHHITAREIVSGCYVVTATASLPDGRQTTCIGAVPITKEGGAWESNSAGKSFFKKNGSLTEMTGDDLCNAMMKAETKAKRRATLDLLGLGILDETEASTIPGAEPIVMPDMTAAQQAATAAAPTGSPDNASGGGQDDAQYKTVYDNGKGCWEAIQAATELRQLGLLYFGNMELIDRDKELTTAFKGKREEFTKAGQILPSITPRQYQQLQQRVRAGDMAAAKKASASYAFDDAQKQELNNSFKAFQSLSEAVKLKYENADQLAELMEACTNEQMIRTIYANNAMIIDRTPALSAKYKNRLTFFNQAPQN